MVRDELISFVSQAYKLPRILDITPVDAGFLSQNFVLKTTEQRYFLKQYRYTDEHRVAAAHRAKHFFAQADVPVILPVASQSGKTFLNLAAADRTSRFISVFPYVDGRHLQRGYLPQHALESMAQMMAHIHRAGKDTRLPHVKIDNNGKSYKNFVETASLILRKIPQESRTTFDELAEKTVHRKLSLAKAHRAAIEQIDLISDHFSHGDYQDGNVFFDLREKVSHIFDWEKTAVLSRGLELARAIALICFGNAVNYIAEHSEENFARARWYLQAYHEHYPISRGDFIEALTVRYLHKTMSLWVETDHYLESNNRVDIFLEPDYWVLHYYAENFEEYVARVCEGILRD